MQRSFKKNWVDFDKRLSKLDDIITGLKRDGKFKKWWKKLKKDDDLKKRAVTLLAKYGSMNNDCFDKKPTFSSDSKVPEEKQEEKQKLYLDNFKKKYDELEIPFTLKGSNSKGNCKNFYQL
jgi:hypothetical protein